MIVMTTRIAVTRAALTAAVVLCATLITFAGGNGGADARHSDPAGMPVISRNAPAHTNDDCGGAYPASLANDQSYDTQWRTCNVPSVILPLYLAYDLSGVSAASRGRVVVAWYNDPTTSSYDHNFVGVLRPVGIANDIPSSYTVQGNAAPGGSVPGLGWITLASVSGNSYHSRQHVIDLTGYNWLRLHVTASDGSPGNQGVFLNLDVHSASAGVEDDWIFFGDSITEAGMAHNSLSGGGGTGTWAQMVSAANDGHFPAYESGGIGGTLSADGASRMNTWLSIFPGRYVGLSYGSNDAGSNVSPAVFRENYVSMVDAVIAAGKLPVIPKIIWSCNATLQANIPALNAEIDRLYATYPSIVRGPDLWSYFQSRTSFMSGDCLHLTEAGYVAFRQQWVSAMSTRVYRSNSSPTPVPTTAPTPTPTPPPSLPLPTLPPLF